MQKEYNKAVRDKIPEIIRESGKKLIVRTVSDAEFLPYIEEKIAEEMSEYFSSQSIEELADLLEVIYRIAELKGVGKDKLEEIRHKKRVERGGFSGNLILVSSEI